MHIQTLIRDILDMPDFDIFEEIYNETNIDLRTYIETINTITNETVVLAENNNIKISLIDSIHVNILGYFDKNDSRIISDFRNINTFLILDDRYIKYYIKVFAKISTEGDLIFENNYSLRNDYMQSKLKNLPEVDLKGNKSLITEELLKDELFKKYYIEDINSGCFYKKNELTNSTKTIMSTKKYGKQYRKFKGIFGNFAKSIENIPDTYQNTFGKKYQFGIEIETISGYLPLYLDNILYYSAVHDGSLRDMETGSVYGAEYVSDVLWGDLGLLQLKKLCYELTKRCLIDKRCGNHVHLSGVTFNQENIVLMYFLYQHIENEVFNMMPKSRHTNEYCRRLTKIKIDIQLLNPNNIDRNFYIKKYYDEIIQILSQKTHPDQYVNKKNDHPKGFKCGYDHSAARYCWVNFIPAVFNTRKNGVYTINFVAYLSN